MVALPRVAPDATPQEAAHIPRIHDALDALTRKIKEITVHTHV